MNIQNHKLIFPSLIFLLFFCCGCAGMISLESRSSHAGLECDEKADKALKNKDWIKSIELHEGIIKENPENVLAIYHLGYSYGRIGDHDKEIFYYERAIASGFTGSNVFFNLGMAYGEMGQFRESVRVFKKAMKIEPANPDNHFGLALAYQKLGRDDLAEEYLLKTLKIDSKNIDARYYLGVLYSGTGKRKEAQEQLEKIRTIDPENPMGDQLELILIQ